ncbi:MAG: tRNA-dihydrouridine synthase family protein [Fimbriimonadaceae bacterium]|nr:tRNA-dihydrouridine synthase family protein [Fimbriimonadaceae bacterium]QYK55065.1 MAG: tRNA-dihydrouridine synthase family protein [Fimbriimonadaceae bacterium]
MLKADLPALVLAPMDGVTDAPMRALMGEMGAFSFAVSEFVRVSQEALPAKVFRRAVPELLTGAATPTGLPIQVQILGGDPDRMAASALNAVKAGATAIDINFGCPAKTVNRNDGGATLLKAPCRIRELVRAVRQAVPRGVPVSAKLRLGWETVEDVYRNAEMAAEGGADWLTVHARTRVQGYQPPVYWKPVGRVAKALGIPVVANGDIWNLDDFRRCQDETGARHFMLGRSALANPLLPGLVAAELGLSGVPSSPGPDWPSTFRRLLPWTAHYSLKVEGRALMRLKQWGSLAHRFGGWTGFERVKRATSVEEFLAG